ncbi:MAG TPA: FxLYD domain-containing protein [Alphaproteobacteria bacterium]
MVRTHPAPKSSRRRAAICVCSNRRISRTLAALVFCFFCLAAILCLAAGAAQAACAPSDVELKSWKWERDAGWFTITGEIRNGCAEPTGAQLEIALRDASGQTVSVEHVWPAKSRNLKPGETYAFKTMTRGYATAKDVSLRIIDVRHWPEK